MTAHRSLRGAATVLVRRIKAGQTGKVHAGQWIVEQPSDIHRASNRGTKRIVITLATLLEKGAPPSTPVP